MSDFFSYGSSLSKKKDVGAEVENPFLLESDNPEVYVLTDLKLSKSQIGILRKLLSKYASIEEVSILYTYDIEADKKEVEKSITKVVIEHAIDFSKHIPPRSKIVTLGRALYSITKDTSIQVPAFHDTVWNDTKFYDPNTKSWVFPVAWLFGIYDFKEEHLIDTYDLYHFKHQVKYVSEFISPSIRIPGITTEIIENPNEFLKEHWDEKIVSWDLETGGFDSQRDGIRCITMSFDGRAGYYLRWNDIDYSLLKKFFVGKYQIGANLKFDCRFLWNLGITTATPDFDTLHAGHLLNEIRSNSLKTHAWVYTYHGGYDLPLEEYKRKYPKTKSYLLIPESILVPYATKDAIVTYQVWESMVKHLKEDPLLEKYFFDHVMPNVKMFIEIEAEGVFINWKNVRQSREDLLEKRTVIEEDIYKEVGHEFNISSTTELAKILEFELKLPQKKEIDRLGNKIALRSKANLYFTNEEHLEFWKKKGFKIADLLLEYRGYSALLNTFVGDEEKKTAYWEYKAPDEKIYPSYSVMMAQSHRNKAKSPNMQQVPHHGDKAQIIRSFFDLPSKDYLISEFDYSGLQLRIAAILSGDENMRIAFTELGGDLHSFTAAPIFCPEMTLEEFISKKKEEPYSEYRFTGKSLNFGVLFGMGHHAYSASVIRKEWSLDRCKTFCKDHKVTLLENVFDGKIDYHLSVSKYQRDIFLSTYSGLVSWHKSSHEFAKENGYVRYTHGGRRLLPQMLHPGNDKKTEASLKNISLNSPVQNFEIVLISRAMRSLHAYFKDNNLKSSIWNTVHDAIGFYIHKDEVELLSSKIPEIMQEHFPEYIDIPIEVEGDLSNPLADPPEYWGYGKAWYEDQEIKI